jgi:glyoxylate reductase
VAQRAAGFDMKVLHTSRTDTGRPGYVAELGSLLARADIVSLHVPLTESTRHLIGAAELALMKPTAVIVNTARGPVIDEDALADALEAGTIYGAGLDVFVGEPTVNPRLLRAPRTTLLPHIGSATIATRTRMARLACQGVCDVLAGVTPPNLV